MSIDCWRTFCVLFLVEEMYSILRQDGIYMYIMTVEKMIKIRNHYNTMNTFNLMVPLGILFGRGRMLIFVLSWMEGLWTKTEKKNCFRGKLHQTNFAVEYPQVILICL